MANGLPHSQGQSLLLRIQGLDGTGQAVGRRRRPTRFGFLDTGGTHLNVGPHRIERINGSVFRDSSQAARYTVGPKGGTAVPLFPIFVGHCWKMGLLQGSSVSSFQSIGFGTVASIIEDRQGKDERGQESIVIAVVGSLEVVSICFWLRVV